MNEPSDNGGARPWVLGETSYADIKSRQLEVAVIPFGATEPHNLHLPYGTDTLEADEIGQRACAAAFRRGAEVIMLPTIPYGTETNMRRFPLAINLNPSTLTAVIRDLCHSVSDCGIRKILLLNSHGGNDFKPVLRELAAEVDAHLFLCNWYQMIGDVYGEIFERPDDHAGEMETSLALAYFPRLVATRGDGSLAADEGATRATRFDAVNRHWISLSRPWHLLTTNSGAGNPHAATADRGRRLMEVIVARLSDFLCELSASQVDDTFPY